MLKDGKILPINKLKVVTYNSAIHFIGVAYPGELYTRVLGIMCKTQPVSAHLF
jgi:hypothetical protein